MTKLFSMKSLAFAGAAAFALTLTPIPAQVISPAVVLAANDNVDEGGGETEKEGKVELEVEYSLGILRVKITPNSQKEEKLINTADGTGLYIGTGKNDAKLKYSLVSTTEKQDDDYIFDISGLLGKKSILGVSFDGKTKEASVELAESSSLKASLDGNDIKVTVGKSAISDGLASEKFTGYTYQYKVGNYGEWVDRQKGTQTKETEETDNSKKDTTLETAIKQAKVLGSTIYVRIATEKTETTEGTTTTTMTSPWSKEAKVKVAAKAKAPKVSVKTAGLTKAFEWKMGDKVEYRISISGKTTYWTKGSTSKIGWETIINNAIAQTQDKEKEDELAEGKKLATTDVKSGEKDAAKNLVDGDAIANDMIVQVRTAAKAKKAASNIAVLSLAKSIDSPTPKNVQVKVVQNTKKGATASKAAISAATEDGYTAQYSTDGGTKWKNVKSGGVELTYDKLAGGKVKIRLVYTKDKKTPILPSPITELTIPQDGTKKKDDQGNKLGVITSEGKKANKGLWETVKYTDYEAGTVKEAVE